MADLTYTEDSLRQVPQSIEAEQSVLGAILIDPSKINEVTGILKSTDFYLEHHIKIFEAMQALMLESRSIDLVTLVDTLVSQGTYTEAGGKAYIKTLAESVPSLANIRDYARIVKDKAQLRRLSEAAVDINKMALEGEGDVDKIIDTAEQKIFSIARENLESKNFTHIREAIMSNYSHLQDLKTNKEEVMGTPTYFVDVDRYLVGMGAGDLILIGARPGMGKTSFALNIAVNVACRKQKSVAIFSLEMSTDQLVSRMLCSEGCIDSNRMRTGELEENDWINLSRAADVLVKTDILIDDTAGITITSMKAKLRRVKNLGLVVIDYLQLMQSDKRIDNKVQEVAEISRNLKLMAKDLKVPVICLSQLSRSVEGRSEKMPLLSDLRDSGAIEQDADAVMFLYRPDYYAKEGDKNKEQNQNIAECNVAKNRHGSTGTAKLGWFGQYTKFTNLDTTHTE